MVKIGQEVQFVPRFCSVNIGSVAASNRIVAYGHVIFVNPRKQFFVAEYDLNGVKLREGFQFFDIGKVVRFLHV